jgi:hypothetical protein
MVRFQALRGGLIALAAGLFLFTTNTAHALPSFALQTGLACKSCHIGAFGPQLTPLGRAFKIGGYTQKSGDGWQSTFPVALMFLGSYTNTQQGQGMPAAQHYGPNGNFAMDQINVFLGGRITDYAGAFVQGAFDGITSSFKLDNTDLRLTTPLSVDNTELRIGLSVNNGPTVQDPYNSTYAWGYPFASSALAPTPAAQPILAGTLLGNSLGATVYGWYDRSLYLAGC